MYEAEIQGLYQSVKTEMLEYLEEAEPDYTRADVDACLKIMDDYRTKIGAAPDREVGMLVVKEAVLALNALAERAEELIETSQREDLAEIIILGAAARGFNDRNDDITEEWREW